MAGPGKAGLGLLVVQDRIFIPVSPYGLLEIVSYTNNAIDPNKEFNISCDNGIIDIAIHPQSPYNFVLGYINEPFTPDIPPSLPAPTDLSRLTVSKTIEILDIDRAWLGVIYQFISGKNYYEVDENFTTNEDWADIPYENYLIRTKSSLKEIGKPFTFNSTFKSLLDHAGWGNLDDIMITRFGIGGDIEKGGHVKFQVQDYETVAKVHSCKGAVQ